jgi:flagellar biosynthesis protein FlhB
VAENREDRSREDLTEEASPYRIEEYRRRGQVSQSREVTALLAMIAAGGTLYLTSPQMGQQMSEFMREVFRTDLSSRANLGDASVLATYFTKALRVMILATLPVAVAGFVLGALGSFVQIGSIFSWDPVTPDLSKVSPLAGLKRIFSLRQALDGVRMTLKTVAVLLIAVALIKGEAFRAGHTLELEAGSLLPAYGRAAALVFLSLAGVLAVFAAIDFGLQRWEYSKNLRMTKQEAKQEHKEREGDPQIKARIRSVQRELARRRMMQAVKKADVIVTNPTHIAVAIVYSKDKHKAPRVVAKGADFLAQKIKKIAAEAGVPLVENVPLARTLFKTVKIGQEIPRVLYQAVAEVLAYVYRLKGRGV